MTLETPFRILFTSVNPMYDVRPNAMNKHHLTQNYEDFLDRTDPEDGSSKPLRNAGTYQSPRNIPEHRNLPVQRCEKPKQHSCNEFHAKIVYLPQYFTNLDEIWYDRPGQYNVVVAASVYQTISK
jgi:hypothetical protein